MLTTWLLGLLNTHKWKIVGLGLFLGVCLGSYYYGQNSVEATVITNTVIQEKIVTVEVEKVVVHRETVTVVVRKPDGTVTETTTEVEDIASETNTATQAETTTASNQAVVFKPDAKKYRLGAFAEAKDVARTFDRGNWTYGMSAGARVMGPVWAEGGYNFGTKAVHLGLAVEF